MAYEYTVSFMIYIYRNTVMWEHGSPISFQKFVWEPTLKIFLHNFQLHIRIWSDMWTFFETQRSPILFGSLSGRGNHPYKYIHFYNSKINTSQDDTKQTEWRKEIMFYMHLFGIDDSIKL